MGIDDVMSEVSNGDSRDLLDELEDELDDEVDLGSIKKRYMPKIIGEEDEFNSSQMPPADSISRREVQELIENLPKPMIQKSVQPGASPLDNDDRFLCWNDTGIIRSAFSCGERTVDIMFHDSVKHMSTNMTNDKEYCYGSLSDEAIALGSNGPRGSGPATLHGINLLESNRDEREWDVQLPHIELIEGIAVGRGFVAVATDLRNLRLFTNAGMQSYVFTIPGQLVSLVAYEKQLMTIYHHGAGHANEQSLCMEIQSIDIINNEVKQTLGATPVALGRRSPLSWAGFSDEGTPCSYDYTGMVRMFRAELGNQWVPILDMKELTTSALEHYFVVGVNELSQVVKAVRCKRSRYPDITTECAESYNFNLPLCESHTSALEEEHVRLKLAQMSFTRLSLNGNKSYRSMATTALKTNEKLRFNNVLRLFANYLEKNKDDLALNLVYMIPSDFMRKLPEFAWQKKKSQYFIDSLNRAIEEREQMEMDLTITQQRN